MARDWKLNSYVEGWLLLQILLGHPGGSPPPGPALSHFVGEGVLVHLFNEPMTERIGNPERTPNDPLGQRLQQPRIPSINLHPLYPP
jgi:hypothetical protein